MSTLSLQARNHLAMSYVLGNLPGPARRGMVKRIARDADLAERVRIWEAHFARLLREYPRVLPPDRLWIAIEKAAQRPLPVPDPQLRRVPAGTQQAPAANRAPGPAAPAGVSPLWRIWAVAASLLLMLMGAWISLPPELLPPFVNVARETSAEAGLKYVGALSVEGGRWLVSTQTGTEVLKVRVEGRPRIQAQRAAELWWIGSDGSPRSLGLLPLEGAAELRIAPLSPAPAPVFSVSVEPPGGSTTGLPTGPVVAQFPAIRDL
jgi:anti-sigma-K factor RskA